ncbi:thioesterase family protein [Lentibacillus sp. Marseille-P4043]|uniref:thioesterase family protein n=1 Tax=Lentibacillus sp. Marseille-P4043 TaxID=2040293 RepID=UPI000D0B129D|nr:thioesterase [Lentibacillus sp. Marseille-P4043]
MKEGLKVGDSATLTAVVTNEMVAQFDGEIVHPAYSTVSMVYHMEWASRKLLLPFLEDHEEGMGSAVTVKHIAPSGLGTKISVTATVTDFTKSEIVTDVCVENEQGLIGKGEVKQAILPKKIIEAKLGTYETANSEG